MFNITWNNRANENPIASDLSVLLAPLPDDGAPGPLPIFPSRARADRTLWLDKLALFDSRRNVLDCWEHNGWEAMLSGDTIQLQDPFTIPANTFNNGDEVTLIALWTNDC